jgi:hypothetical protein
MSKRRDGRTWDDVKALLKRERLTPRVFQHTQMMEILFDRTCVGFWQSDDEPHLPQPLTNPIPHPRAADIAEYLCRSQFCRLAYGGFSTCRLCGVECGSHDFGDDCYIWPEGLAHYVVEHNIHLSPAFVAHVLQRLDESTNECAGV